MEQGKLSIVVNINFKGRHITFDFLQTFLIFKKKFIRDQQFSFYPIVTAHSLHGLQVLRCLLIMIILKKETPTLYNKRSKSIYGMNSGITNGLEISNTR